MGLLDKGTFLAAVMCYVHFTVEELNEEINMYNLHNFRSCSYPDICHIWTSFSDGLTRGVRIIKALMYPQTILLEYFIVCNRDETILQYINILHYFSITAIQYNTRTEISIYCTLKYCDILQYIVWYLKVLNAQSLHWPQKWLDH